MGHSRRTSTASTSVALTGAVVAVLALAGCGSSDDSDTAADHPSSSSSAPSSASPSGGSQAGPDASALQTALTTTSHSDSARIVMEEAVNAGGKKVAVHGSGVTSLKTAGPDARGDFTVTAAGQKVRMLMVGTTLYEKLPPAAATSKITGGKPWIKIDTTKIPRGAGDGTNEAPDASAQLAYLGHAQRVTKVGTETVDGAATTHYRVAVPPQTFATSGMTAGKSVPVDVWIDAQHRVRQEKLSVVLTADGSSASTSGSAPKTLGMTMTLHLSDFGTPVRVTAPPAGQVTDATQRLVDAAKSGSTTTS